MQQVLTRGADAGEQPRPPRDRTTGHRTGGQGFLPLQPDPQEHFREEDRLSNYCSTPSLETGWLASAPTPWAGLKSHHGQWSLAAAGWRSSVIAPPRPACSLAPVWSVLWKCPPGGATPQLHNLQRLLLPLGRSEVQSPAWIVPAVQPQPAFPTVQPRPPTKPLAPPRRGSSPTGALTRRWHLGLLVMGGFPGPAKVRGLPQDRSGLSVRMFMHSCFHSSIHSGMHSFIHSTSVRLVFSARLSSRSWKTYI